MAVALARESSAFALGIDLEDDAPLERDLLDLVCTERELAWLSAHPALEAGRLHRLVFSAKECTYKCQYPRTGVELEFRDLEIDCEIERGTFTVRTLRDLSPIAGLGDALPGRFVFSGGQLLTALVIRASMAS